MRVWLRHVRTGHFYLGHNDWSLEPADALDFGSIERALEVLTRDNLQGMSIVVRYAEGEPDQVFDLSGSPSAQPSSKEVKKDEPEI